MAPNANPIILFILICLPGCLARNLRSNERILALFFPTVSSAQKAAIPSVETQSARKSCVSPKDATFSAQNNLNRSITMGIMSFIRGQLIEIIEWTDDSRDTISFRFEDNDAEIKRGAQLIVRESQVAQFVYLGEFGDTFGPGKHSLTTDNIPILTTLKSWKYGFESPFKADVYFVTTRLFTGNKWGTSNPIMMRDQDFGIVRVRAFGTYDFRVSDPKLMLKEVAGSDRNFRLDEFTETMRSRIVSIFSDALASAKIPVLEVATRYQEVGEALLPLINPIIQAKYGVELASFVLENVSVPAEVEQAIDKRSSMAAVGNLNDYVKFQMAQGMEKGGSAGGVATEMAVGLAMAQQIMQQQNSLQSTAPSGSPATPGAAAPVASPMPELLSPAQAAETLGVSEADVMQSLEKGELKGKKIGSAYRITRAALNEFLQS
jgi:excisionase family DNA binding protein